MNEYYCMPIPLDAGHVDGWKSISVAAKPQRLVPLGAYSAVAGSILTSSVYYGEHDNSPYRGTHRLAGSLLTVFVREGVAKRLIKAQRLLPEGYRLLIFDAYRPLQVQDSLFHFYRDQLRLQCPGMSEDALDKETQKYVSIPSADPSRPSPHNTGGAVDLAIVKLPPEQAEQLDYIDDCLQRQPLDLRGRAALEAQKSAIVRQHADMLNFGTSFDHGGERAAIAYFEKQLASGVMLSEEETEACNNRRLLYWVMAQVGMQAYQDEWWHFNAPESQMGAAAAGLTIASYGTAAFAAPQAAHEELRQQQYAKALRTAKDHDPRTVAKHWPAEIIGPQDGTASPHRAQCAPRQLHIATTASLQS